MTFDPIEAYRLCYLIRYTEEEVARRYPEGKMRTPTHLSIGQEAVAVGVMMALKPEDVVYSTHRCHAHYLAKGGSVDGLVAELYGKATGCAGGLGGSMHLVSEDVGFMGTSAVVGSSVSVAVGHALAFQLDGAAGVAVAFMGDAGLETGQVWEAFNFAALKQLPILFVVEDNDLSTATRKKDRQPQRRAVWSSLAGIHSGHRMTGWLEPMHIHTTAQELLRHLPAVLEVETTRYREHVGPGFDDWRKEIVAQDMLHDPVKKLAAQLDAMPLPEGRNKTEREIIEAVAKVHVAKAFERAEAAPWPEAVAA